MKIKLLLIRLLLIIVLAITYYGTAQISRIIASTPQNVTPVWPPDGFATAFMLLFGYWIWPGVFIGSFMANFWAFTNHENINTLISSTWQILIIATGTTCGTLLGSFLLRKFTSGSPLDKLENVRKLLLLTGILAPMINATSGVTALTLGGKIEMADYSQVWLTWWISNVAGIFIFTPVLLTWGEIFQQNLNNIKLQNIKLQKISISVLFNSNNNYNIWKIIELILLISLVIFISKNSFHGGYFLEYMLLTCLLWAVFRFGKFAATNLIMIISIIAVLGTVKGLGAFSRPTLNESLILLQSFITVIVSTTLVLNAVITEKQQALITLKKSQLQLLYQSEQLSQKNTELEIAKQEAIDANRSKSKFLSNMSHELRTPLNGILGIAQTFQDLHNLTDKQKQDVDIIYQSGLHLLALMEDILDISKIEANKMELEPDQFNLSDFLTSIVEICRHSAINKHIDFIYQFSPEIPIIVEADQKRLKQILLNLLSNAIKFTDSGQVQFVVNIIAENRENHRENHRENQNLNLTKLTRIKFEVMDTGIGINSDEISKIFLPFEQFGDTRLKTQGTGLGLAISQKLAQMMGSNITVTSELGKGSIFSLELDLPTTTNAKIHINHLNSTQIKPESHVTLSEKISLKILLAEDNLVNQKIANKLFAKLGYTIDIAENGMEVLNKLKEKTYDVIFMDVQMPELDGIETTKTIHQEWGNTNRPYIIALTANAMEEDKNRCFDAGMDDFITKPVKLENIIQSIENYHVNK